MSGFTIVEDSKKDDCFKYVDSRITQFILRDLKCKNIESINKFKVLKKLELVHVDLASLPESIGELSKLEELDLHKNHLTSLPEGFGNLGNLKNLNLNDNRLTSLPESFGNLSKLENLFLEDNHLTSLPESFGNLSKLEFVQLKNNRLTSLPESIRNFKQPYIYIFVDNGVIVPDNLPGNIHVIRVAGQQKHVPVDPEQVHKEAAKIDYDRLIDVLKNKTTGKEIDTTKIDYADFINTKMTGFIEGSTEKSEEEKKINRDGLKEIMDNRLGRLNYSIISKITKGYVYYVLEYVELQPQAFKDIYVTAFVSDCVHAYEGKGNAAMSCSFGALERILLSLQPAFVSTSEEDKKKAEYNEISYIISNDKKALALEYIKEWFQLHKIGTKGAFLEGTTLEDKIASLKAYLTEKFPSPEDKSFIKERMEMAKKGFTFDDNEFEYGGRRTRKARKTRKGKSIKKNQKSRK